MESNVSDRLEAIYREHRQGLYTLALAITRRTDRAEDAVQDAFARLWQSKTLPGGDLVPYVFASVRNASVDQWRRASAAEALPQDSVFNGLPAPGHSTGNGAGPAQAVIDAEIHARLRDAVDTLPQDDREVVTMRIYAGLKFEQIAEALGQPLPTVASRYRRALETLSHKVRGIVGASHE